MKKIIFLFLALPVFIACSTNAVTGRKQLALFPEETLQQQALSQYQSFLSQSKVVSSSSNRDAEMVKRVGTRIARVITDYYTQKGLASELNGYKWEFNLIDNKEANAWCMPGGKVVVYTGLLNYTQNEAALAIVMGHEIGHAVARHGNERMSQGLLAQLGGMALDVALANNSTETRSIFLTSYGVGSTLGVLAFSRTQESEADKLGIIFSAMAGYDPRVAISFWQRMSANSGGGKPPEFLSTHPSDQKRIKDLQAFMPKAMSYYKGKL